MGEIWVTVELLLNQLPALPSRDLSHLTAPSILRRSMVQYLFMIHDDAVFCRMNHLPVAYWRSPPGIR